MNSISPYLISLSKPGDSRKWFDQAKIIDRILPLIKDFSSAIDGGAHWGIWTRELAKYFDRVVAIEPVSDNFNILNIDLPGNVEAIKSAIGSLSDETKMFIDGVGNVSSHVVLNENEANEIVPMIVLDDLVCDGLGFIKLDLEGYEYRALKGAMNIIEKHKPVICIEMKGYWERYSDPDPRLLLTKLGYHMEFRQKPDEVWIS